MYYVYVLYSEVSDKIYIGYTTNPQGRLESHNHPKNKGWTKRYQPWKIIHSESFYTKSAAMKREQELKSHQGRDFIHNLIKD